MQSFPSSAFSGFFRRIERQVGTLWNIHIFNIKNERIIASACFFAGVVLYLSHRIVFVERGLVKNLSLGFAMLAFLDDMINQ